jgi:hypothetical protein
LVWPALLLYEISLVELIGHHHPVAGAAGTAAEARPAQRKSRPRSGSG